MNFYNLLRLLIKGAAQTGGFTKTQAYDAMNLIDELEKVNGFSHILKTTTGIHEFVAKQKFIGPYSAITVCGICEKERYPDHE